MGQCERGSAIPSYRLPAIAEFHSAPALSPPPSAKWFSLKLQRRACPARWRRPDQIGIIPPPLRLGRRCWPVGRATGILPVPEHGQDGHGTLTLPDDVDWEGLPQQLVPPPRADIFSA